MWPTDETSDQMLARHLRMALGQMAVASAGMVPPYDKTKRKSKSRPKGEQKRARRQNRRKK